MNKTNIEEACGKAEDIYLDGYFRQSVDGWMQNKLISDTRCLEELNDTEKMMLDKIMKLSTMVTELSHQNMDLKDKVAAYEKKRQRSIFSKEFY